MWGKKKVVHISYTPLAGAPLRLSKALNKYSKWKSRLITLDNSVGLMFDNDLLFFKDKEKSLDIIANADILHFHHPFTYYSEDNFFGINFTKIAPKAKYVMHFHSTQEHYYNHPTTKYNKDIINTATDSPTINHYSKLFFLTTPHCAARYFPKALIMPNFLDIHEKTYQPDDYYKQQVIPKIGFFPSHPNSTIFSSRWDTKSAIEVLALLEKMQHSGIITYETNNSGLLNHKEMMEKRKRCDVLIDDISTGSYHQTALEGLAIGKPTISFLDQTCLLDMINTLEADNVPIINANFEILEQTLKTLSNDIDLRNEIGIVSRKWMEKYYTPEKLVKRLENFYAKVLHNEPIIKESLLNNKTRTFFQVTVPDIIYDYRKEKYNEKQ